MQNKASRTDFKVLIGMILVLGAPFALTLMTVQEPRPPVAPLEANPTPHGYTWSLSLFIIPVLGLIYKKFGPHPWHEGFPGYFLFLTAIAITPSIVFFPVARCFINWRAFSLAFLFILFVSLFWEATIAVPYQWWGFQPPQMLGLFINGFCGLPIEEPILWMAVTWGAVIVYETVYTLLSIPWTKSRPAAAVD
jgi:hypothetical protein